MVRQFWVLYSEAILVKYSKWTATEDLPIVVVCACPVEAGIELAPLLGSERSAKFLKGGRLGSKRLFHHQYCVKMGGMASQARPRASKQTMEGRRVSWAWRVVCGKRFADRTVSSVQKTEAAYPTTTAYRQDFYRRS
jgi:hypothetical protein